MISIGPLTPVLAPGRLVEVNTAGLSSAQIDALFSPTPANGTAVSDPTNGLILVRQAGSWVPYRPTDSIGGLDSGEGTMDRDCISGTGSLSTQQVRFTFFRARKTETINNLIAHVSPAAIGVGQTLFRMGLYSVSATAVDLVAAIASDPTIITGGSGERPAAALTTPFSKVAGVRYAIGILSVGGSTQAQLAGATGIASAFAKGQRMTGSLASQADLPSTVLLSGLAASSGRFYVEMTP